jgi:CBS domain-containing protein
MVSINQLMKQQVVTLPADTSVVEAARIMNNHKIGSVFVRRNERIVGIVTEPDIVRKVVSESRQPSIVSLETIMSSPVVSINECRPVTDAADLMHKHGTRHLAVMRGSEIIGVLSVRDLLQPVSVDQG